MWKMVKTLRKGSALDPLADRRAYQTYSMIVFALIASGCFMVFVSVLVLSEGLLGRMIIFLLGACMLGMGVVLFPKKIN